LLAHVGDDSVIRLHDQIAGKEAGGLRLPTNNSIRALAWSPDGKSLAFTGVPCGLNIWDLRATHATPWHNLTNATSLAVAWSPDGLTLAVAAGTRIKLVETRSGQLRREFAAHSETVRSLAWSPDSKRLASAGDDSLAKIWDASTGREVAALTGHAAPVYSVAWNREGDRVLTGSWDHTAKLWHPGTGIELCSLEDLSAQVAAVAFSPDGRRIAISDLDGDILIYNSTPGRPMPAPGSRVVGPSASQPTSAGNTNRPSAAVERDEVMPYVWFRQAAEKRTAQGDLHAMRLLVRFLAAAPYPELRDGPRAVALGEQAAAVTHRNNAGILDDLAAAYAEAGRFAKAVAVQKEAMALLHSPTATADCAARLRLYEANCPSRDFD
jgi:Tol biopolymer transport system component